MAKKRKWKEYRKHKIAKVEWEPLEGTQKTIIDIMIKKVIPITDEEKQIAKQLREMKANGYYIDLPLE